MGVKSLWSLLNPVGRPVMLETIEGKALAIDSSIWIYQFQATMRDKEGRGLINAHVLGFLRRLSKLLFYGIKPVFVFDGGAPALKRSTIIERKKKKLGAAASHARIAEKLLAAQMRREAVNHVQQFKGKGKAKATSGPPPTGEVEGVYLEDVDPRARPTSDNTAGEVARVILERTPSPPKQSPKKRFLDHDPYALPSVDLPTAIANAMSSSSGPDPRLATEDELRSFINEMRPGDFDVTSLAFRDLPTEVQYEIIGDLRLKSRQTSYKRLETMLKNSPTPLDFSRQQIKLLKQRNELTQQLLMTTDNIGAKDHHLEIPVRIASERNKQYVLVKNEGKDGGWILGVRDERGGTMEKPIEIDPDPSEDENEKDDDMVEVKMPADEPPPQTGMYDIDLREHQRSMALSAIAGRNTSKGLTPLSTKAHTASSHQQSRLIRKSRYRRSNQSEHSKSKPLFAPDSDDDDPNQVDGTAEDWIDEDEDEDVELSYAIQLSLENSAGASRDALDALYDPSTVVSASRLETALAIANASPRKASSAYTAAHKASPPGKVQKPLSMRFDAGRTFPVPLPVSATNSVGSHGTTISATTEAVDSAYIPSNSLLDAAKFSQDDQTVVNDDDDDMGMHEVEYDLPIPQPSFSSHSALEEADSRQPTSPSLQDASHVADLATVHVVQEVQSDDEEDMEMQEVEIALPQTSANLLYSEITVGYKVGEAVSDNAVTVPSPPEAIANTLGSSLTLSPSISHFQPSASLQALSLARDRSPSVPNSQAPFGNLNHGEQLEQLSEVASDSDSDKGTGNLPVNDDPKPQEEHSESWDAAEEMDVQAEQSEFASFLSEVANKDLNSVRQEIDEEIKTLNQQRKAAMRDSEDVTQAMINQIMMMLRLFGIPYITAPMEAEAQCAELVALGLVEGVITDDSDVFLFGTPPTPPSTSSSLSHKIHPLKVYKNMFNQSKTVEVYHISDLTRELGLDRGALIRLAYLLGSDYTDGLPGVGPVLAMELLREFPGDDGLFKFKEWWGKVQMGRDREEDASAFKKRFKKKFKDLYLPPEWPNAAVRDAYYHPTVDSSDEPFKWGLPDLDALRTFLNSELGWGKAKVDELLLPIIQKMNRRTQAASLNRQGTLANYIEGSGGTHGNSGPFGGGSGGTRRKTAYASKRLQKIVTEYRKERLEERKRKNPSSRGGSLAPSEGEGGAEVEGGGDEPPKKKPRTRKAPVKKAATKVGAKKAKGKAKAKKPAHHLQDDESDSSGRGSEYEAEQPQTKPRGRRKFKRLAEDDGEDLSPHHASEGEGTPPPLAVELRPRPKPRPKRKSTTVVEAEAEAEDLVGATPDDQTS